jgi:hypothetical protein
MQPDDDGERWRLEIFRDRLRHSLAARFLLRFHVSLFLAGSVATGWIVDRLLLGAGWQAMLWRYPLAIAAAYLAFLGGVAAWLRYSGIREYLDRRNAAALVGDDVARGRPTDWRTQGRSWDAVDIPWLATDFEGCLLSLLLLAAFFAFGRYLIFAAPSLFADVVLELLLAAGLLRGVRRIESSGWIAGVWANTWPTLAFALAASLFVGWLGKSTQPPSSTLPELIAYHLSTKPRR